MNDLQPPPPAPARSGADRPPLTGHGSVPSLESLEIVSRLVRSSVEWASLTILPDLERRVGQLRDHGEREKAIGIREAAVRDLEEALERRSRSLAQEKALIDVRAAEMEGSRQKTQADSEAALRARAEAERLRDEAAAALEALRLDPSHLLPSAMRTPASKRDLERIFSLHRTKARRLYAVLLFAGLAEESRRRDLYVCALEEMYASARGLEGELPGLAARLAERFSGDNPFDLKIRIPARGSPVDFRWMSAAPNLPKVTEVDGWALTHEKEGALRKAPVR